MCLRFTWQAWHLAISTCAFCVTGAALMARGRRGTWRHACSFVSRGTVALGDIHLRFAWQAWHLWHWAGVWRRAWAGISRRWRRGTLRGRRGTWRHVPSFHVAGVALGDIYLRFAWQASGVALTALGRFWWRAWTGVIVAGDAAALCVAGVAHWCSIYDNNQKCHESWRKTTRPSQQWSMLSWPWTGEISGNRLNRTMLNSHKYWLILVHNGQYQGIINSGISHVRIIPY